MNSILLSISITVVLVCVSIIGYHFHKMAHTSHKKKELDALADQYRYYFNVMDDTIASSVSAVNKKMVTPLKASGNFTQRDKEEAFEECKQLFHLMISPSIIEELGKCCGHVNDLVKARIEYHVRMQKK